MSQPASPLPDLSRLHFRVGWAFLLVFLSMGLFLESMHGFKIGWYNDVSNATRREMFTLAHAHGTLLAVIHLVFGASVRAMPAFEERPRATASICLTGAGLLLPIGFFLAGFFTYSGDPGLGIFLVPPGAILLFVAVFLIARGCR